jgi:hypothetical protein
MLVPRSCCLLVIGLLLGLVTLNPLNPAPAAAAWISVYENDFQTSVGPGWSSSSGNPLIITTATSGRNFLGEYTSYMGMSWETIGNDTLSLSLSGLPAHTQVRLSFDLYIFDSWDGNDTTWGPDIWDLSIAGGRNIIHTTFGSVADQAYPGMYPGGSYPARTGASENNTLGHSYRPPVYWGDSVYNLSFEVPHSASSVVFQFTGSGLQGLSDESWGLDNVQVEVVPLPPSLLLLGSGLLGLAAVRLRFRKS